MKNKFDKDEILDKAMFLFWEKGFQHCSMAILKKELGLSASSIYHAWASKEGLFLAALDRYRTKVTSRLAKLMDSIENGYDAIVKLFDSVIKFHVKEGHWGCLSSNTITEMAYKSNKIMERTLLMADLLDGAFKRTIKRGQEQGVINSTLDADALTTFLMTILQGIHVRVKTTDEIRQQQLSILPLIKRALI